MYSFQVNILMGWDCYAQSPRSGVVLCADGVKVGQFAGKVGYGGIGGLGVQIIVKIGVEVVNHAVAFVVVISFYNVENPIEFIKESRGKLAVFVHVVVVDTLLSGGVFGILILCSSVADGVLFFSGGGKISVNMYGTIFHVNPSGSRGNAVVYEIFGRIGEVFRPEGNGDCKRLTAGIGFTADGNALDSCGFQIGTDCGGKLRAVEILTGLRTIHGAAAQVSICIYSCAGFFAGDGFAGAIIQDGVDKLGFCGVSIPTRFFVIPAHFKSFQRVQNCGGGFVIKIYFAAVIFVVFGDGVVCHGVYLS